MSDDPIDLHSRPGTFDESGKRIHPHPSEVGGRFQSRRAWVRWILLSILLIAPWVKISGNPALLLDVVHGRFSVLGAGYQAHDAPLVVLVGVAFLLAIAGITAVLGRAWCGWACPQTVYVEGLFRPIERWLEGDALARRRLDEAPWNGSKLLKKVLKWGLFAVLSVGIVHSFVALFVGADALAQMQQKTPLENWGTFLFTGVLSALLCVEFGWLREQFCLIACPYGRLQSVLTDSDSLGISYDAARGEPRRGYVAEGPAPSASGDCIDCNRCVKVCPTGIDIRNGTQQLECIACAACVDACDDVMTRLKKPLGLIRYASETEFAGGRTRYFRPRVAVYLFLLSGVLGLLGAAAYTRKEVTIAIYKTRGEPFQRVPGPEGERLLNTFHAEIANLGHVPLEVRFQLPEGGDAKLLTPELSMSVPPGDVRQMPVTIEFPARLLLRGSAKLPVSWRAGETRSIEEVTLVGPFQ